MSERRWKRRSNKHRYFSPRFAICVDQRYPLLFKRRCLFAVIPISIYQGAITAAFGLIQPIMTAQALSNLSMVGSVIILATGISLIWDKDIKVANLTPALFVAVALAFF